jgi:hypothetical protein
MKRGEKCEECVEDSTSGCRHKCGRVHGGNLLASNVATRKGRRASPGQLMRQPPVLNMKTCPGGDVPDGAIYIGDHYYRAGYRLPRSQWFNRFKIDAGDAAHVPGGVCVGRWSAPPSPHPTAGIPHCRTARRMCVTHSQPIGVEVDEKLAFSRGCLCWGIFALTGLPYSNASL